jgi:UDP-3-O-[3-hydroxymyristoyl] glucosamine N-acyltransferase
MSKSYTVSQIAQAVSGQVRGEGGRTITGISSVEAAGPDQVTWVAKEGLVKKAAQTRAGAVLIPWQWADHLASGATAILVERPEHAIIRVLAMFEEPAAVSPGIHPTAVIDPTASLGGNVSVGPHAVVGPRATIGDDTILQAGVFVGEASRIGNRCVLWPNVVVRERCVIGNRVIIHPNATIGADGFGYEFIDGRHVKVPQIGNVVIEDDVEIGANTCIDRAKFGSTTVRAGAKIDNLVQIAHNVEIGPGVVLAALVGIAGSAKIGAFSVLGGKVGVGDHCRIGSQVQVGACSCVPTGVVPDKAAIAGILAYDARQWKRGQIAIRRLPELLEQVKELARRVAELESTKNDRTGS